jgi:hypothetical protein
MEARRHQAAGQPGQVLEPCCRRLKRNGDRRRVRPILRVARRLDSQAPAEWHRDFARTPHARGLRGRRLLISAADPAVGEICAGEPYEPGVEGHRRGARHGQSAATSQEERKDEGAGDVRPQRQGDRAAESGFHMGSDDRRARMAGGQQDLHLWLFFAPSFSSSAIVSGNGWMRCTGPFAMSAVVSPARLTALTSAPFDTR